MRHHMRHGENETAHPTAGSNPAGPSGPGTAVQTTQPPPCIHPPLLQQRLPTHVSSIHPGHAPGPLRPQHGERGVAGPQTLTEGECVRRGARTGRALRGLPPLLLPHHSPQWLTGTRPGLRAGRAPIHPQSPSSARRHRTAPATACHDAPALASPVRGVAHSAQEMGEEVVGGPVGGVDAGGVGAAGEQDPVGVQGEGQIFLGRQKAQVRVVALAGVRNPAAVRPGEVGADDDPAVAVLESLGAVDAADLLMAAGVRGPQLVVDTFRGNCDRDPRLGVFSA